MEEACDRLGLGTRFEYTEVGNLQQNGRIEHHPHTAKKVIFLPYSMKFFLFSVVELN